MDLRSQFPPVKGKRPTHFFMDGGTLHVPQDRLHAFSKEYVNNVSCAGRKVCLVESCDPQNFIFFLDLDYKSGEQLSHGEIEDISVRISTILNIGRSLVLVTEPRVVAPGVIKSGVHIVWPGKITDRQGAMDYRQQLIDEMGDEWEVVLDAAVYRGGLRLPWSWKYDKKTNSYSKPYIPIHVVTEKNKIEAVYSRPDEHLFRMASIIVPPHKREGWFDVNKPEIEVADKGTQQNLELFMRYNVPHHKSTAIKSMWKNGDQVVVTVKSTYCENKGGAHSSNHTYFVLNKRGEIYQKCHDECCRDFRGTHYLIPAHMRDKIFSD